MSNKKRTKIVVKPVTEAVVTPVTEAVVTPVTEAVVTPEVKLTLRQRNEEKANAFATNIKGVNDGELAITFKVMDAIHTCYAKQQINPNALGFVYGGMVLAGTSLRPAQQAAINKFINEFVGVTIKKDEKDSSGFKIDNVTGMPVVAKNIKRSDDIIKKLYNDETMSDEMIANAIATDLSIKIAEAMEAWLDLRGGNLFGKVKAVKVVKDADVILADKEKSFLKSCETLSGLEGMTSGKKLDILLKTIASLGFTDVSTLAKAVGLDLKVSKNAALVEETETVTA